MLRKFKDILGIEGVKVELICPEVIPNDINKIAGVLKLTTVREQTVNGIEIKLIEKYARGRKDKRLIDEYVLGEFSSSQKLTVLPGEEKLIDFSIEFTRAKSAMDKLQDDNIFYKGIVSLAKLVKKVKSTHRLEGSARVKGTKLNPTVSKEIKIRG